MLLPENRNYIRKSNSQFSRNELYVRKCVWECVGLCGIEKPMFSSHTHKLTHILVLSPCLWGLFVVHPLLVFMKIQENTIPEELNQLIRITIRIRIKKNPEVKCALSRPYPKRYFYYNSTISCYLTPIF